MSSILEALERAEEERLRGEGAVLRPLPAAQRRRSLGRPLLVLLLALIVLSNLAIWWFYRQSPTAAPVTPPTAQREAPAVSPPKTLGAETNAGAGKPVPVLNVGEELKRHTPPSSKPLISEAVVARPQAPAPKPVVTQSAPVASVSGGSTQGMTKPTVPQSVAAPATPAPAVAVAEKKPVPPAVTPAPSVAAAESEIAPPPSATKPMSPPLQDAAATPPAAVETSPAPQVAREQIPVVWELPQYLREKILQLKSSVHVYNANPAQRFVIINMHRYGEGDSLPPDGFRLKRIERDGIVIDYGDGLVRLEQR